MRDLPIEELDDMVFSDLYVDIEDEAYPNIQGAIAKMSQKMRKKSILKYCTRTLENDTNLFKGIFPAGHTKNQNLRHRHS